MERMRKEVYLIAIASIFIAALASCRSDDKGTGLSEDQRMRLVPVQIIERTEIDLGRETQVTSLSRYPQIDVDSKGIIYLLADDSLLISRYAPNGEPLAQIGNIGQGPGDLMRPYSMAIGLDDVLAVYDSNLKKIVYFDQYAQLLNTYSLREYAIREIRICGKDAIYFGCEPKIAVPIDDPRTKNRGNAYDIIRYDISSGVGKNIIRTSSGSGITRTKKADIGGTIMWTSPAYPKWCICPINNNIYVVKPDNHEVSVFSSDGRLLFSFALKNRPNEMDRKKIKRILITSISFDELNRIWIALGLCATEFGEPETTVFDIISMDGSYLSSIDIGYNIISYLVFKQSHLYAISKDKDGNLAAIKLGLQYKELN